MQYSPHNSPHITFYLLANLNFYYYGVYISCSCRCTIWFCIDSDTK